VIRGYLLQAADARPTTQAREAVETLGKSFAAMEAEVRETIRVP
jgi:hypothetical protein